MEPVITIRGDVHVLHMTRYVVRTACGDMDELARHRVPVLECVLSNLDPPLDAPRPYLGDGQLRFIRLKAVCSYDHYLQLSILHCL